VTRRLLSVLVVTGLAAAGVVAGRAQASVHVASRPSTVSSSTASVIYSNLGPGGAYYPYDGWCVHGDVSAGVCTGYQKVAMPFTGNGGTVTQIDLALTNSGGTNNATVQLVRDEAGVPGAVLGSWSVANQPPLGGCCALTTIHVSPTIPVGAGKKYWVVAGPGPNNQDDTADVWNWNSQLSTGTYAYNNGSGWTTAQSPVSAFDVLGCGKLCRVS